VKDNALGIIGMIGLAVVALAGIAGIVWQKRALDGAGTRHTRQPAVTFLTSNLASGDSYGIVFTLPDDPNHPTDPPPHWTDIENVLNGKPMYGIAQRKEVYRIRKFTNGSAGSPLGDMPQKQLLFEESKMSDALKLRNFSGYAFQIGVGGKDSYEEYPPNSITMPQGHGKVNMRESKEMVEEVNAALGL
jgi:hypothetical protein